MEEKDVDEQAQKGDAQGQLENASNSKRRTLAMRDKPMRATASGAAVPSRQPSQHSRHPPP